MDTLSHLYTAGHQHLQLVKEYLQSDDEGRTTISQQDISTVLHHLRTARELLELAELQASDPAIAAEIENVLYRIDTHITSVEQTQAELS